MDTRTKIVSLEQARRLADDWRQGGEAVRAVIGYFDPLLPEFVSRLRAAAEGGRLIAVVAAPQDAYLEARARAELAAALDFVDAVVMGEDAGGLGDLLSLDEPGLRREFIEYVRRQSQC